MLPIKSITVIEKSINIDFSQQIRLSIFIVYRYNQLILSIVIECYRLSILYKFVLPRFHGVFKVLVNIAPYLTSDTTISLYIVRDIKEDMLFHQNPMSNLFCGLGCVNRIFGGLSSWTMSNASSFRGMAVSSDKCTTRMLLVPTTTFSGVELKTRSHFPVEVIIQPHQILDLI